MIDNLEERLAQMQDPFTEATVKTQDFSLPDDGTYQALVRGFDFFESKVGEAYIKFELEIHHDPLFAGRVVDVIHNLENPDRLSWLKKDLATLGVDVENFNLTQLSPGSKTLSDLLDVPVELAVVTSDRVSEKTGERYRNVYLNKRLGDPIRAQSDVAPDTAGFGDERTGQAAADDRVPF